MRERSNRAVLKTADGATRPWVRIPPPPPIRCGTSVLACSRTPAPHPCTARSPKELLEAAQELGVEFIPCQMTMDMFGLKPEDMIEGMAEPVGAATVIGLLTDNSVALFI